MDNKQIARILRDTAQLLEIDGAIIGRDDGRTCSCIIRPSWATGIAPCRKEIQSNLRSCKAQKVPRLPTSRKRVTEKSSLWCGRQKRPSAGHFIL